MPTNFPGGLDDFTNPTAADNLNTPAVLHSDQHANENDAIEALQAKVGIDGSLVTGSFDYRVRQLEASGGHSPVTLGLANGLALSGQQLSMGLAGTTATGTLSAADWNTFNNKQPALGYTPVDIASAEWIDLTNSGTTTLHSHANGGSAVYIKTVAPTMNDDANDGYEVGDFWIIVSSGIAWQLTDSTPMYAIWRRSTMPEAGAVYSFIMSDGSIWNNTSIADVVLAIRAAGVGELDGTYDARYAPIAKGVTNGDSHDHNGGDGAVITDANLSTSDITTNDVTTSKHGFAPKAPNDTTKFLRGDATWSVPASGSGATPHEPGGRLTLLTGTPVMTTEQAAKTSIYYTPYKGDLVPIYDGSVWTEETFVELALVLDADSGHTGYHQSGKNFDLFIYDDGGTLRLVSGAAWTNDTTRAIALERVNGILVNAASMTARFGSASGNTVTVAQGRGTYVGTFRASANGTTTWEVGGVAAGGNPILWYLWNMYNRIYVSGTVRDNTDSWTYNSTTYRSSNNNVNNRLSYVCGMVEDALWAHFAQRSSNGTSGEQAVVGVGLDRTNGSDAHVYFIQGAGSVSVANSTMAILSDLPTLGFHFLQMVEASTASANCTFFGDAGGTLLQSGMHAHWMA